MKPAGWLVNGAGAAAALAMAAGCTSSSQPASPSGAAGRDQFIAAVNRVCERAVAKHAGHSFPVASFNPEQPEPTQLPAVADYFAQYGGVPQTTSALAALSPPTTDAAAWARLLVDARRISNNIQNQIVAARRENVVAFVKTVHISEQLTDRLNQDGARFGFTPSSACGEVFG